MGMEALLVFAVIVILSVLLDRLATRALDEELKVQPCEHEVSATSYTTGETRCIECGELLSD